MLVEQDVRTVMTGLVVGESPRWHDGRLWLANWGASEIIALDAASTSFDLAATRHDAASASMDATGESGHVTGKHVVKTRVPTSIPFSIDWLPDGRMLLVSGPEAKLLCQQTDGSFTAYADLSHLAKGWNEIVVDGRGNTYVNGSDYKFAPGEPFVPGVIALVTPDGAVRQVADDIHFPNGMVVTPDNKTLIVTESFKARLTAFDIAADGTLSNRRVWADLGQGGDGMCLDAEGAVWTPAFRDGKPGCARVRDGGQVLQWVELDHFCFACMLGGSDGRTLYMLVAEWQGMDRMRELFSSKTGRVLAVQAPAPHAGRP